MARAAGIITCPGDYEIRVRLYLSQFADGIPVKAAGLKVRYGPRSRPQRLPKIEKKVQKSYPKWVQFLYGPFFSVIGFFYRTYTANRARVARFMASKKVAGFLRLMAMLILVAWIAIWAFASEESRTRLVDDIKNSIGGIDSIFEK